jgi:hypothetical protein
MYLKGMGAVSNPGFYRPGTVVLRIPLRVRTRGMGQVCTNGGAWDPGLKVCCAPPGTPPMQDPCSILNNPAFLAQQNAEIAQDIATSGPLEQPTLQALTGVPINIGNDAVYCQSNPGATFVDSEGIQITCPSASHTDVTTGGQPMSTLSLAQLAAQLNAAYGSRSPVNPGNAPYVAPVYGGPGTGISTNVGSGAGTPSSGSTSTSTTNPGGSSSTSSSAISTPSAASDLGSQIATTLGGSVSIAGVSLPIWGLGAAALAALWFFGGKR